jgi:hypothetical protein
MIWTAFAANAIFAVHVQNQHFAGHGAFRQVPPVGTSRLAEDQTAHGFFYHQGFTGRPPDDQYGCSLDSRPCRQYAPFYRFVRFAASIVA